MAKQTFEQYVRTELISSLSRIQLDGAIETTHYFVKTLLADFNPTNEEFFKLMSDKLFAQTLISAHKVLFSTSEGYQDDQVTMDVNFLYENAGKFFKTLVHHSLLLAINKVIDKNFDEKIDDMVFITFDKPTITMIKRSIFNKR